MIDCFRPADRPRWADLWRGYLTFYNSALPPEQYDHTWQRLLAGEALRGLALRRDGRMVGIVHYLLHPSAWTMGPVCYLQDLFIDPAARGTGGGRTLIEAVADAAAQAGAARLYWLTQSHNEAARRLYDRLAQHTGFIRYEYPL